MATYKSVTEMVKKISPYSKKVKKAYHLSLKAIEVLMDEDPEPDSADGKFLKQLSTAIGNFEKKYFPHVWKEERGNRHSRKN